MSYKTRELDKTKVMRHSRYGTRKIPLWSEATKAKQRTNFADNVNEIHYTCISERNVNLYFISQASKVLKS